MNQHYQPHPLDPGHPLSEEEVLAHIQGAIRQQQLADLQE